MFFISFGICTTPETIEIYYVVTIHIERVPIDLNSLRFITYAPPFILAKLFLQ